MTKKTKKITPKWDIIHNPFTGGVNNFVLEGNGFHISYNPNTGSTMVGKMMDEILNIFSPAEKKGGGEETALCKDEKFYILNGDFRKEYEKLVPKGFDACYKFYLKNKEKYGSPFSSDVFLEKQNYINQKTK